MHNEHTFTISRNFALDIHWADDVTWEEIRAYTIKKFYGELIAYLVVTYPWHTPTNITMKHVGKHPSWHNPKIAAIEVCFEATMKSGFMRVTDGYPKP